VDEIPIGELLQLDLNSPDASAQYTWKKISTAVPGSLGDATRNVAELLSKWTYSSNEDMPSIYGI